MISYRRLLGVALLAGLAAFTCLALGACAKNDLMGVGLDRTIIPKGAGPEGVNPEPDSTWKWAVNSIDSVVFTDDIDSTTLEVTSFELTDSVGRPVSGTTRYVPGNSYIYYTQPFPDPSFAFFHKADQVLGSTMSKVYFVPDRPLAGHGRYVFSLTSGVRLVSGRLRRDVHSYAFTTGDSVPPPNPIWLP